jgi:hypothetical protein
MLTDLGDSLPRRKPPTVAFGALGKKTHSVVWQDTWHSTNSSPVRSLAGVKAKARLGSEVIKVALVAAV